MALVIKTPKGSSHLKDSSLVSPTEAAAKPKTPKRSVTRPPTFAVKYGNGNGAPTLKTLCADRVSLYLKLSALIRSVIASGKPSELTKMRSYLRGVMQPSSADKSSGDLEILKRNLDYYAETRDPTGLIDILNNTDKYREIKSV